MVLTAIAWVAALHSQPKAAPAPVDDTPRERPALMMQRPNEVVSAPTPASTPEPEVRRAEPVEVRRAARVAVTHMPDGSSIVVERILGKVFQQEDLPLTGNPGDAYIVAGIPFVWTQLANGQGAWIDPQIIQ